MRRLLRQSASTDDGVARYIRLYAVEQAAKSLRDLRIAEVVKLDMQLDDEGKVEAYRAKLNVSFKFEGS
jgi:flavin-binding protein dodecin